MNGEQLRGGRGSAHGKGLNHGRHGGHGKRKVYPQIKMISQILRGRSALLSDDEGVGSAMGNGERGMGNGEWEVGVDYRLEAGVPRLVVEA